MSRVARVARVPRVADGLRLAVTTLTVLPVRGPAVVDRATAARAMTLAPVVGLGLGLLAAGALLTVHAVTGDAALAAVAAVAALAVATRGLHLDGLADTADGLGSGRPAAGALEVMRRSDVGPFGVVALVLVLLAQVAALAVATDDGRGPAAVLLAVAVGRAAVVLGCGRDVPAARAEGLGALVAGTQPRAVALAWALGLAVLAAGLGAPEGPAAALRGAAAVAAGLGAAALLLRHCRRRLGGTTGDVLGALVEAATTAALVVLAAGAGP